MDQLAPHPLFVDWRNGWSISVQWTILITLLEQFCKKICYIHYRTSNADLVISPAEREYIMVTGVPCLAARPLPGNKADQEGFHQQLLSWLQHHGDPKQRHMNLRLKNGTVGIWNRIEIPSVVPDKEHWTAEIHYQWIPWLGLPHWDHQDHFCFLWWIFVRAVSIRHQGGFAYPKICTQFFVSASVASTAVSGFQLKNVGNR